jgi:hypothetical protein
MGAQKGWRGDREVKEPAGSNQAWHRGVGLLILSWRWTLWRQGRLGLFKGS